jgi:hypothetical protein
MGALLHLFTKLAVEIRPFRSLSGTLAILCHHIEGFHHFRVITTGYGDWPIPGCVSDCFNDRLFIMVVDRGAFAPTI